MFQSMIAGQNIAIHGGTFTQNISDDGRKASLELLKMHVAHTAFHNSGDRFDPPKCHPNTRVAVIKKIMDWVRRTDWETRTCYILWLTGAAGAGKSAIAQTIIELCLKEGLVIASFFFFRSDGSRNHGKSLIATLAYQIFFSVPAVQQDVLFAINNDPLIFTKSLHHQIETLIIQPFRGFCGSLNTPDEDFRRLIVIDGLDECVNHDTQSQILSMLSDVIRTYKLPIVFLIASRPEHDINTGFNSKPMCGIFTRLYLDDTFHPDKDIQTFLEDSFGEIKTNHPFKEHIPVLWPSPESIFSIVKKSSGQFIYAATVVRYVKSNRHQPRHRLEIVMNLRPPQGQGDLPFAQLDALYTMILSSATDIDRVLYALSIYSLGVTTSRRFDVSTFMALEEGELDILFCDLHALVSIKSHHAPEAPWTGNKDVKTLHILHASLHDFLLDRVRSERYFTDIETYRTVHLGNILRYLTIDKSDDSIRDLYEFFEDNFRLCHSSPDLMRQASLYSLVEDLDETISFQRVTRQEFLTSTLLPFFRCMARLDKEWASIDKRQHEALDHIFLSRMPDYYDDIELTVLLCLICHAGTDRFVPCVELSSKRNLGVLLDQKDLTSWIHGKDSLSLYDIDFKHICTDQDQYRHRIITFLQEPERSGRYTVGRDAYTRAVLFFIGELERLSWTLWTQDNGPDTERNLCDVLVFDNELWTLRLSADDSPNYEEPRIEERIPAIINCFVYLGYIHFFLSRAEKSNPLVRHCQQQSFLTEEMARLFPKRTAFVRRAMKTYLESIKAPNMTVPWRQ